MKIKTLIPLIVAGLSVHSAVLRAQDRPVSETVQRLQEARSAGPEGQEAEALQRFGAEVQRNQDQAAKQQAQAGANAMYQDRLRSLISRSSAPISPGRSLIIRSSEFDPKEQANLEEDLVVMSHLLEKTVGSSMGSQPQPGSVLGVNVVFAPGQNPTRGLYLEGYGALFTLSVGFPLLPSAKESDEKENPSADSTWNEARQEVFGQRMDGRGYGRGEEYDERKVNTLKDSVLEALKNATHIRGLKADDSVTVCVFGGGAAMPVNLIPGNKPGALKPREVHVAERPEPRSTMLTIRVKKADVDSFAKDKLNLDDFRKKAKITPYPGAIDSPRTAPFGGGATFGGGVTGGGAGGGFGANPGF